MSFHADRAADILAVHGETCTLRRLTSGSPVEVAVKAKWFTGGPETAEDLVGVRGQTSFRVMLSNAEIAAAAWPGPPKKGDFLVRGVNSKLYRVMGDADTRMDGDDIAAHFIVVTA